MSRNPTTRMVMRVVKATVPTWALTWDGFRTMAAREKSETEMPSHARLGALYTRFCCLYYCQAGKTFRLDALALVPFRSNLFKFVAWGPVALMWSTRLDVTQGRPRGRHLWSIGMRYVPIRPDRCFSAISSLQEGLPGVQHHTYALLCRRYLVDISTPEARG